MAVNSGKKNFTYTAGSSGSNFHQNNEAQNNALQQYVAGAYGPSTPQSVLSQYQGGSSGGGGGSNGGGGSSSSSSSLQYSGGYGGGGGGGFDYAGMIQSMLDAQRAAAQAAYDASRARLDEAWGNTQNSLSENLASALSQMEANYKYGEGVSKKDAAKSLREAYINYMMNKRNLGQNLAAMGMSGGATESNLARLFNNYGTSRNGINETLANNLAQLLNTYENNVSSAEQAYNSQYADAMNNYVNNLNQLEQMLASNLMSSYSGSSLSNLASYASTLAGLQNSMAEAAEAYTPTENTLAINNTSMTQGTDLGSVTDYAKYQAMMNQLAASGAGQNTIIQQLASNGVPRDAIYSLFGAT